MIAHKISGDIRDSKSSPKLSSSSDLFNLTEVASSASRSGVVYIPSSLETTWTQHRGDASWLDDPCAKLNDFKSEVDTWSRSAQTPSDSAVFSQIRFPGKEGGTASEWIEPLAFMLRHPKATCGTPPHDVFDKTWLVLASKDMPRTSTGKRKLFDAGGNTFGSGTKWFVEEYAKRGVPLDEVFVWEIKKQPHYFDEVPEEMKERIHLFDGVPVTDDRNSPNNPLTRLAAECSENDFCVFKLDVDTPLLESSLLQQLLDGSAKGKVDEFFFEMHVHGRMQHFGWGERVSGTFADTYAALRKLREVGIRAHSWV